MLVPTTIPNILRSCRFIWTTLSDMCCRIMSRLLSLLLLHVFALCTVRAVAVSRLARTIAFCSTALADSLIGCACHVLRYVLASLQVCKSPGFVVNFPDLLVALNVEASDFLSTWGVDRLLKVRVQTRPASICLVSNPVRLIDRLRFIGRFVPVVEIGECRGEPIGETVLVVERDGLLDSAVGYCVAMSEVLGDNSRSGFVFLCYFVILAACFTSGWLA